MYMYICIYIYTYIHTYTYTYAHIHTPIHTHTHTYTHKHISTHTHTPSHTPTHIHPHTHKTHIHVHITQIAPILFAYSLEFAMSASVCYIVLVIAAVAAICLFLHHSRALLHQSPGESEAHVLPHAGSLTGGNSQKSAP